MERVGREEERQGKRKRRNGKFPRSFKISPRFSPSPPTIMGIEWGWFTSLSLESHGSKVKP